MTGYPEFKQFIFDMIKRGFEKSGGIHPICWMQSNTESNIVYMPILEPMDTKEDQQKLRFGMIYAAIEYKAEMIAFISEGWMAQNRGDGKRAGEYADRREVILINLECNNLTYIDESFFIEIDQKTRKLIDFDNPTRFQGVYGWNYGILKAASTFSDAN